MTHEDERPKRDGDGAPEPSEPDPGARRTSPLPGRDRADSEQDLRSTSDEIRADVDRLTDIEAEKQQLDPEDPRIDELSEVAVSVADRIAREARAERQLGRELG